MSDPLNRYRRRRVVNRQENVEPFSHPCQNSEPRCRPVALWQNLHRVRRTHHAFLEGGLESRPPFQFVSSIEFWSVVLTAFDQGGSKSEPPSLIFRLVTAPARNFDPSGAAASSACFFSNPSRAPSRKNRTLRRWARAMRKKLEPFARFEICGHLVVLFSRTLRALRAEKVEPCVAGQ